MKSNIILLAIVTVMLVRLSIAQNLSPQDEAAIKKPALDYIEGWYAADASRMESALHPELAKRIVQSGPDGKSRLDSMGAMTLVQRTRAGGGSKTPKELQQKDITILDRFNNAAVVKVVASSWIDYLEEAKVNGFFGRGLPCDPKLHVPRSAPINVAHQSAPYRTNSKELR